MEENSMKNYVINLILVNESSFVPEIDENGQQVIDPATGKVKYVPRENVEFIPKTQFSVEFKKNSNNAIIRGNYQNMFLYTLSQEYHRIKRYVYNHVYGTDVVAFASDVINHRVVNNYDEVLQQQLLEQSRLRNIRITEGSMKHYEFKDCTVKAEYSGKRFVSTPEYGTIYSKYYQKFEEICQKDGLDIILDRISKSNLLGRDCQRIYNGLLNANITVKHIRSAKQLNKQLKLLRSIAAANAPIKTFEPRLAETSISAYEKNWKDTKAVHPITVNIPHGMYPMVYKWLREDSAIKLRYIDNTDYNVLEEEQEPFVTFVHTTYKDIDLDPELNQYNESRCHLEYNTEKDDNQDEGTFSPAWKNQIEREDLPEQTINSWKKQFTLLKVTDKQLLEIIKYSIGNPDTIFELKCSVEYAVDRIARDRRYLKEVNYQGKLYYLIDKDTRLFLDGIAKKNPGADDPEDDNSDTSNMYCYKNDSDDIIEVFSDNYQEIDNKEYLVFDIE